MMLNVILNLLNKWKKVMYYRKLIIIEKNIKKLKLTQAIKELLKLELNRIKNKNKFYNNSLVIIEKPIIL